VAFGYHSTDATPTQHDFLRFSAWLNQVQESHPPATNIGSTKIGVAFQSHDAARFVRLRRVKYGRSVVNFRESVQIVGRRDQSGRVIMKGSRRGMGRDPGCKTNLKVGFSLKVAFVRPSIPALSDWI
jgi:hypothetical protein